MVARFVSFEGLDGSGKSTHLRRAAQWLGERGVAVEATHEPGGTPLGQAIRAIFLDRRWREMDGAVELLLLFASRRQHLLEVIEPALAAGRHVLCDRFTDSTRAYQGHGRGVAMAQIDAADALATGGRRPDATLLFDLPAAAARARLHAPEMDRLDAEELAFHERVRRGYLALAAAEPARFHVIDAAGDREATAHQVETALAAALGLAPAPPAPPVR
jgi:dTMP kinase